MKKASIYHYLTDLRVLQESKYLSIEHGPLESEKFRIHIEPSEIKSNRVNKEYIRP